LIKVAIIGLQLEHPRILGGYEVHGVPLEFANGFIKSPRLLLRDGVNAIDYRRSVLRSEYVDELYRTRDPVYMSAANQLIKELENYDILIFSTYNPLHPEMVAQCLVNKLKVLGFTDDPHSTYVRGIPYLWAFDAAYYISPSYSSTMSFEELFKKVGFKHVRWLPLVQPIKYPELTLEDIRNRSIQIAYVGNPTGSKMDRIVELNGAFGENFALYGKWRFNGYYGFMRPLLGERPFLRKVHPISVQEKRSLYLKTMIGFNMHVSDLPSECGNMRTYETAAFGMMPLCDRGGLNLQTQIFEEGKESIYYNDLKEAIELAHYYLKHSDERIQIAWSAHKRAREEYSWEKVMFEYLEWLSSITR
jgi:glycosyltransferase involved in cell wall biosynthesis